MWLFRQALNLEKEVIHSLENSKAPFVYFVLTFFFAATLRNFLEVLLERTIFSLSSFIHAYLSYTALAMSLILLFYMITRTDVLKIAKTIFPSFIILNLAPLLDLILSLGRGYIITYMHPGAHHDLVLRFFTFFGDFSGSGITPGMRIEIALALLMSFGYFYLKGSSLFKSLFYTFLTYALIFWYCAVPFLVKGLSSLARLGCEPLNLSSLNSFYLLIIFLTGIFLVYFARKDMFRLIIRDVRLFRLLHYELMFVIGLVLGIKYNMFNLDCNNIYYFMFIPISIAFAWLYSVVVNNIEDYEIDKVSNKGRPLVSSKISLRAYEKLRWPFLFAALFYSIIIDFKAFFIILLFIGNYFLYSAPPLRLKRVPFFSKLFISVNSLVLVMLGFMLVTGSLYKFSKLIVAFFLIGLTAVVNFIDIKDYEGDKKAGIKTLPVILGLKKSKFIIGLFFMLAYFSISLIVEEFYMLITFFIFGFVQFCLINKKDYNEKYVFLVYLLSVMIFIIHLWIFGV